MPQMEYGFCADYGDGDNAYDTVTLPLPPPPQSEPVRLAALRRLRLLDISPPRLGGRGAALPPELVIFARLVTVQPPEQASTEAAVALADVDAYARREERRGSVRHFIRALASERLAEYPTSASEDNALLNALQQEMDREPDSELSMSRSQRRQRLRCALQIRRAEKRILERWVLALADDAHEVARDVQLKGELRI